MPINYRTDPRYASLNPEQVRRHYEVEQILRSCLLSAPAPNRAETFLWAYDELFRLCPWHPALTETSGPEAPGLVARRVREIEPLLGCAPGADVLEVGCGMGELLVGLSQRGFRCTGVDISRERIERLRHNETQTLRFHRVEGTRLPFPNESFDAVVSMQLFEHLHPDDAWIHLCEVLRVLKPQGRYLLETPNKWAGPGDVSRFFSNKPKGFHLREYTIAELTMLFRAAGYVAVEIVRRRSRVTSVRRAKAYEYAWRMLPRAVRRRFSLGLHNPIYVGRKSGRRGSSRAAAAAAGNA